MPALIYTSTVDDDGVSQTLRTVARDGAVRIVASRWEERLTNGGDLMYDVFTGEPMLASTLHPGLVHRASYSADQSRLTVRQTVDGDAPEVTFVFARQ